MEASDGSPPPSLCMIRAAELFPKPQMEKEDTQLKVPFQELAGESVKYLGRTDDGVLALSNYRMFLQKSSTNLETSIPLGLIEAAQCRDLFHLIVYCKDASTVKCSFETAEQCTEWQRRIQMCVGVPETLESIFAFPFCSWACDTLNGQAGQGGGGGIGVGSQQTNNGLPSNTENGHQPSSSYSIVEYAERLQKAVSRYEDDFMREVERLGFDLNGSWRISHANEDFKLCPSYPPKLLVPCCISDETLQNVANFRGSRRLPAVVWRHRTSGAVIARCSQPEVGWLGWRNTKDEQLLKALADACAFDRGEQMRLLSNTSQSAQSVQIPSGDSSPSSPDGSHEEVAMDEVRKVLIVDARSYTSAVTNRARGGGCECIEYYPCAEIEFMNLGNIHVIRKSFHALRQLCASPPDVPNWLGLLEKTMWLQHLSGLLAASMTVCHAIEKKGRPVLVHCSDGWDRTPQIVATAQLCLDPYYRTVEGFRVLVEREWLSYGHKFADRCGHGPGSDELNERCPVFLQWLDLVHQIHKQFRCSFEFSMGYLIKLAQHSHSGLFGNFLCNTLKERMENSVFERTFSVWSFLSGPMYRNPLYKPNKDKVLWPAHNVRDLSLWTEVYLGSLGGNQSSIDFPAYINESLLGSMSSMSKTRSYGDLITAGFIQNSISRRSSDPNMTVDPNLTIGSNSENNSIADLQSDEREESPDLLANLIHDTTRKLENLTNELNNHDNDDDFKLSSKLIETNNLQQETIDAEMIENNGIIMELENLTMTTAMLNSITSKKSIENNGCENMTKLRPAPLPPSPSPSPPPTLHSSNASETKDSTDLLENGLNGVEHCSSNGVTIAKNSSLSLDLMHSVVGMEDTSCNTLATSCNGSTSACNKTDNTHNLWHGSVNTSTDTLVPMAETKSQNGSATISPLHDDEDDICGSSDVTDAAGGGNECSQTHPEDGITTEYSVNTQQQQPQQQQFIIEKSKNSSVATSTNCNILPKVHTPTNNITRPNQLSTNGSSSCSNLNVIVTAAVASTAAAALDQLQYQQQQQQISNKIQHNLNASSNNDNKPTTATSSTTTVSELSSTAASESATAFSSCSSSNNMEESILILPEHQKLEISISGKCETIAGNTTTSLSSGSNMTSTHQQEQQLFSAAAATTLSAAASVSAVTPTATSTMSVFNLPYVCTNTTTTTLTPAAPANTTTAGAATSQRRRRTSSSNSKRDGLGLATKNINGSYPVSRFSLPGGVRSLPMTPPGLTERPQVTISCPDGLAHALSEENIRLQQIVHEHKMREDVLLREIHDMRMALLKKICPNCNNANASATNDEQKHHQHHRRGCTTCCIQHKKRYHRYSSRHCCDYHRRKRRHRYCRSSQSIDLNQDDGDNGNDDDDDVYSDGNSSASACSALDNVENASICSWEAVEDRSTSGPSSCTTTSSSIQPNAASVLWVPDHAVSRCTSCQTEFWLGRRKHHCRSCGQIFCADCSEFWAPLPDEKLFSPVRLCGPCYHSVTTRMQQVNHQLQNSTLMHLQQSATKPAATSKA